MKHVLAVALILVGLPGSAQAAQFGNFIGSVVAEWLTDGRKMKLVEPFAYVDPHGRRWDAPRGSIVDGASIPKIAWSIIGGPFEGKYRDASVIHDVACVERQREWQVVHDAFYTAMRASGVNQSQAIMYAAVYHFGPRWPLVRVVSEVETETRQVRVCINMGLDKLVCYDAPETTTKTVSRRTEIPPPEKTLTEGDFQRLADRIENAESSGQSLSLEDIRNFR